MLHPECTGTADLNEQLVFESLAADDRFPGVTTDKDKVHMIPDPKENSVADGAVTLLREELLGHVLKEIPDHAGGDGCCVTATAADHFALNRVQVKLGASPAGPKATRGWQGQMVRGNMAFRRFLGGCGDITVWWWVSRPMSAAAKRSLQGEIIDTSSMWEYWSDRVKTFLVAQRDELNNHLAQYGTPVAPADEA